VRDGCEALFIVGFLLPTIKKRERTARPLRSGPTKYMQTAKYILFVIFLANKILLAKIAYNDKKQL
jgi:hypothetical protein